VSRNWEQRNKELGESFRQSSRETLVIIGAWVVFMVWTAIACARGARPGPDGEYATAFGMPRWVFFGVVLPWVAAVIFTLWFSMFHMKDTDLNPDREVDEDSNSGDS
jgi:hypothetical protein